MICRAKASVGVRTEITVERDCVRFPAGLLDVPMYDDGSGYDFDQFATDPIKDR